MESICRKTEDVLAEFSFKLTVHTQLLITDLESALFEYIFRLTVRKTQQMQHSDFLIYLKCVAAVAKYKCPRGDPRERVGIYVCYSRMR